MRRIVLVVAVLTSLVIAGTASAARKGPVAKLVELEKRKNEWLRQQFLGK
jgi:outer membrane murein-binding lipoprotein Lpp